MRTRNGRIHPTFGQGQRLRGNAGINWQPCPGRCGSSTVDGRWCAPCCSAPDTLLSKLREAMEALEAHRAPEDSRLVAELHGLTTDALMHGSRAPR